MWNLFIRGPANNSKNDTDMSGKNISRRDFLQRAAVIGGAAMMPSMAMGFNGGSSPSPRKVGANDKVNVALIGIGNRGNEVSKQFISTGMCNVVALCDVDMGAKQTQEIESMCPGVPKYKDFRKLFDKMARKIDAVVVCTPDHSHFPICMAAMREGIHVYVEKPLARTFYECEMLMQAEKKYGVVTRWHGWDPKMTSYPAAEPVPATLDWDTWLCAAHEHSYNHDFHNGQWRCWYEFGMGVLGDWGAHIIDSIHEFLDLGLPTEINPLYLKGHNPFFYPMSSTILFKFPEREGMPALDITWYDGLDNIPAVPEGYGVSEIDPDIPLVAGQKIQPAKLNPGKEIYSKELTFKGGSHGSTLSIIPEEKAKEMEGKLPEVPKSPSNHYANFLLSVMLSQVFCLGVISQWTGQKILFDRETKQITNNPLANQLLWGTMPREGWEEFYRVPER